MILDNEIAVKSRARFQRQDKLAGIEIYCLSFQLQLFGTFLWERV